MAGICRHSLRVIGLNSKNPRRIDAAGVFLLIELLSPAKLTCTRLTG